MRWFQVAVSFFMKQHCSQHVDRQSHGNSHGQRPLLHSLLQSTLLFQASVIVRLEGRLTAHGQPGIRHHRAKG